MENAFHEQFFRGETKASVMDLAKIQRFSNESIDNYISRFRQMKARCLTLIPEYELVQMAASGLNYAIRKKLVSQHLRDMSQLADRARQIEQLNIEKERLKKHERFPKKEKAPYVAVIETASSE